MRRWVSAAVPFVAVLVFMAGCEFLRGKRPPPTAPPSGPPAEAGELSVSALPVYRLIVTPMLIDAPSRLLVLQVRFASSADRAMSLSPEDAVLILPSGERGRVFDRGRALELLRRTTLADADLGYMQRPDSYRPGGLDPSAQLNETVMANLLIDGVYAGGQSVQGYVVVDTATPLASLQGTTLELYAYRLSDSQPARGSYQFGTPAAATAVPVVAAAAPATQAPVAVAEGAPPAVEAPSPAAPAATAPHASESPTVTYLFEIEIATPATDIPTPTVAAAAPAGAASAAVETSTPAGEAATPAAEGTAGTVDTAAPPVAATAAIAATATPAPSEPPPQ